MHHIQNVVCNQVEQSASNKPMMIKKVRRTISVVDVSIAIQQISFGQFEKYSSFDQPERIN
jgi:hypothetical protein